VLGETFKAGTVAKRRVVLVFPLLLQQGKTTAFRTTSWEFSLH